eukprot:910978-Prymnesium_polylepis.1
MVADGWPPDPPRALARLDAVSRRVQPRRGSTRTTVGYSPAGFHSDSRDAKVVGRDVLIALARREQRAGEVRVVDRVGEVLRL